MAGLGMAFRKSELYRRIVMLVDNRPLESRAARLWTFGVTCAALLLVALTGTLTFFPRAVGEGAPSASDEPKPSSAAVPAQGNTNIVLPL